MNKIIKLSRKSIKNNRIYKIMSDLGVSSKISNKKLGLLEYKKSGEQNIFLNVNGFFIDFLKGSIITKKLLSNFKHGGLLKSSWSFIKK